MAVTITSNSVKTQIGQNAKLAIKIKINGRSRHAAIIMGRYALRTPAAGLDGHFLSRIFKTTEVIAMSNNVKNVRGAIIRKRSARHKYEKRNK
jgi:hypothetical protein